MKGAIRYLIAFLALDRKHLFHIRLPPKTLGFSCFSLFSAQASRNGEVGLDWLNLFRLKFELRW